VHANALLGVASQFGKRAFIKTPLARSSAMKVRHASVTRGLKASA
jgi:hypothetical protein